MKREREREKRGEEGGGGVEERWRKEELSSMRWTITKQ